MAKKAACNPAEEMMEAKANAKIAKGAKVVAKDTAKMSAKSNKDAKKK